MHLQPSRTINLSTPRHVATPARGHERNGKRIRRTDRQGFTLHDIRLKPSALASAGRTILGQLCSKRKDAELEFFQRHAEAVALTLAAGNRRLLPDLDGFFRELGVACDRQRLFLSYLVAAIDAADPTAIPRNRTGRPCLDLDVDDELCTLTWRRPRPRADKSVRVGADDYAMA